MLNDRHQDAAPSAMGRAQIEAPIRAACEDLLRKGGNVEEIAAALRYLSVEVRQEN